MLRIEPINQEQSRAGKTVVLLDVRSCLFDRPIDYYNNALFTQLYDHGVRDIYLFSQLHLNEEVRQLFARFNTPWIDGLIEQLEQRFTVHGVITQLDVAPQFKLGEGYDDIILPVCEIASYARRSVSHEHFKTYQCYQQKIALSDQYNDESTKGYDSVGGRMLEVFLDKMPAWIGSCFVIHSNDVFLESAERANHAHAKRLVLNTHKAYENQVKIDPKELVRHYLQAQDYKSLVIALQHAIIGSEEQPKDWKTRLCGGKSRTVVGQRSVHVTHTMYAILDAIKEAKQHVEFVKSQGQIPDENAAYKRAFEEATHHLREAANSNDSFSAWFFGRKEESKQFYREWNVLLNMSTNAMPRLQL